MSAPSPKPNFQRIFSRDPNATLPATLRGVKRSPYTDGYYYLMRTSWSVVLLLFALVFTLVNTAFALAYVAVGGILNARPGSFEDAFFFSVQTLGTIGYGVMSPGSLAAHLLVSFETMVGMLGLAMVTGLVFAKFSRPKSRVVFSNVAVVSTRNGKPVLMFRVGNERANHVVEATLRVTMMRTETTLEGDKLRKMEDLQMIRSQSPAFILTWTAIHEIDEKSPLFGVTSEALARDAAEILITLTGFDGTLAQTIHARHSYVAEEIRWGHRFADIISVGPDGKRIVDYGLFHDVAEIPGDPLARLPSGQGA